MSETEKTYTLSVDYDPDAECPNEDGGWRFVDFHPRHINHEDHEQYLSPTVDGYRNEKYLGYRRKLATGTAFLVSSYEHGAIAYSLRGEGYYCPWDSRSVAGILLWEGKPGDIPKGERRNSARSFMETYTQWANGQGMCYSLRDSEDEILTSCCGFLGAENLLNELREQLAYFEVPEESLTLEGDVGETMDISDLYPTPRKVAA